MTRVGKCVRSRCTGKERDSETQLDYFGARYYSNGQGRFVSPDVPLIDQGETNPQSWNLYAYVRNNPLRFIDPTGHACVSNDGGTTYHDDTGGGQSCADSVKKDGKGYVVQATFDSADERANELAWQINNLTSNHQLADTLSHGGQWALSIYGGWKALLSLRGLFGAGRAVAGIVPSITGGVSRAALEAAAADTGETVSVITNLSSSPAAGQALSLATGEGAITDMGQAAATEIRFAPRPRSLL